jgi:hypothetical protein
MPTLTWTPANQRALEELQAMKLAFEAQHKDPLIAFFNINYPWEPATPAHKRMQMASKVADWMIANADTIRDLLKPFDSGVRPASAEKK